MTTRAGGGSGVVPAGSIFTGEGMTTLSDEVAFRMRRLAAEADRERLRGHHDGMRHRLGHALMALGRSVHGIEPDHATRPALHVR